jgi:hypothetical protein
MVTYSAYRARIMFHKSEYVVMQSLITDPVDYSHTELIQLDELGFDLAVLMEPEPKPEYGSY